LTEVVFVVYLPHKQPNLIILIEMKRLLALAFVGIFAAALVASCGSKGGHCDAYGSLNSVEQQEDLAAK
jgi:hypothetical protein